VLDVTRTDPWRGSVKGMGKLKMDSIPVPSPCFRYNSRGGWGSLVAGSTAAGRAARVVLFVLVVVDALQVFVI